MKVQHIHVSFFFLFPQVSFSSYVYLDPENNRLTAEKVFACAAIFNIIRIPLFLMPQFCMEAVKLAVSVRWDLKKKTVEQISYTYLCLHTAPKWW